MTEAPAGQYKGTFALGPSPVLPCGPCSLETLQAWEKAGKRGPRPNIRGVKKPHLRQHLRDVHGVGLDGQPIDG